MAPRYQENSTSPAPSPLRDRWSAFGRQPTRNLRITPTIGTIRLKITLNRSGIAPRGIGVAVIAVIVILDPNGDFPHLKAELRDNGRVVGREPAGTGREFVCAVAGGGEAA
jgi:hypothetical protein